jgi:hypothetical protein
LAMIRAEERLALGVSPGRVCRGADRLRHKAASFSAR